MSEESGGQDKRVHRRREVSPWSDESFGATLFDHCCGWISEAG